MKRTFSIAAALAIALSAPVAHAEDVVVRYGDLKLGTADGQRRLTNRIERAARIACGYDRYRFGTRIEDTEARECYEKARSEAFAQVSVLTGNRVRGG